MKLRHLIAAVLMCAPLSLKADTADDCIADYEAVKAQFESASANGSYECIRMATALNLIADGSAPGHCSGEDEWHLEATSVVGNPGQCRTRLLGSDGEGCEVERITRELSTNEAAQWQNYLFAECRELGVIRGLGRPAE